MGTCANELELRGGKQVSKFITILSVTAAFNFACLLTILHNDTTLCHYNAFKQLGCKRRHASTRSGRGQYEKNDAEQGGKTLQCSPVNAV